MKKIIKPIIWVVILLMIIKAVPLIMSRVFPRTYKEYVTIYAQEYDVSENLLLAVIKAESDFKAEAVSPKGAKGLMQLMDSTAADCAKELGINEYDIYDVGTNVRLGTYYLSKLLKKYDGNETVALSAYNAGHGNVDKWLDKGKSMTVEKIPFPETQGYVKKILVYEKIYKVFK